MESTILAPNAGSGHKRRQDAQIPATTSKQRQIRYAAQGTSTAFDKPRVYHLDGPWQFPSVLIRAHRRLKLALFVTEN